MASECFFNKKILPCGKKAVNGNRHFCADGKIKRLEFLFREKADHLSSCPPIAALARRSPGLLVRTINDFVNGHKPVRN
jgi:hypothetical protein